MFHSRIAEPPSSLALSNLGAIGSELNRAQGREFGAPDVKTFADVVHQKFQSRLVGEMIAHFAHVAASTFKKDGGKYFSGFFWLAG